MLGMESLQQIIQEVTAGAGWILLYVAVLALSAFLVRRFTHIDDELFRKLLHMILIVAFMFWPFLFDHWFAAALTALVFIALFYPALVLLGRFDAFTRFANERKAGEFKASMTLVLLVYVVVLAVCWGWGGERILAVAAISAWGYGDAAAALVGKRFGRHTIEGPFVDGKKTLEGTAAMFIVSFVSVLVVLAIRGGIAWYGLALTALAAALASTIAELISKHGYDTVTCPLVATAVILPMTWLFGGVPV